MALLSIWLYLTSWTPDQQLDSELSLILLGSARPAKGVEESHTKKVKDLDDKYLQELGKYTWEKILRALYERGRK